MINDFRIKYVNNSFVTSDMLERIIKLKMQHWHYTKASHEKWIQENLNDNEYHLWIEDNTGEIISYLNIVFLPVRLDNQLEQSIGIGNVCVDKNITGKGLGLLLMQICNYYISFYKMPSILLCKKDLFRFYSKSGWIKFSGEVVLKGNKYNELLMFNKRPEVSHVEIERNF